MSRIGRAPIELVQGVTVDETVDGIIVVTGPKGTLRRPVENCVKLEHTEHNGKPAVVLVRNAETNEVRSKHGLYRALIHNMVKGVSEGFTKSLTFNGIGYNCAIAGNKITLSLGLSHPVSIEIPEGLTVTNPTANEIVVAGIDNEKVGQFAADIKALKPIEPYHGYGIRYTKDPVHLKEIKKGKK